MATEPYSFRYVGCKLHINQLSKYIVSCQGDSTLYMNIHQQTHMDIIGQNVPMFSSLYSPIFIIVLNFIFSLFFLFSNV